MSDFQTAPTNVGALDPQKRLRYSLGLILGEDELAQEQFYFLERGRLHNRALHGYGTVSGLALQVENAKVTVTPGLAVDPFGREIKVTPAQCADLAQWLAAQGLDSLPSTVYVLLNYKECETDKMPVPGSACRTAAESLVPSRITETFQLSFSTTHPNQAEEELIKSFIGFLASIDVTTGRPPTDLATLIADMRQVFNRSSRDGGLLDAILKPAPLFRPLPTDLLRPSLPTAIRPTLKLNPIDGTNPVLREATALPNTPTSTIRADLLPKPLPEPLPLPLPLPEEETPTPSGPVLDPAQAPQAIRALLRIWVTEIRPSVAPDATGAVLLGALRLSTGESGELTIEVDESERPLLVASRVIQEALVHPEQNRTHAELYGLTEDDHKQYLLVNPRNRALIQDLDAASHKVTNLAAATNPADATRLDQVVAMMETRIKKEPAQHDLSGDYPTLTVIGLQGRTVAPTAPKAGEVLTWTGGKWAPAAPPAGGGSGIDLATVATNLPTIPLLSIREIPFDGVEQQAFELWFHLQVSSDIAKSNLPALAGAPEVMLFVETTDASTPEPFLMPVKTDVQLVDRNLVRVVADKIDGKRLRFIVNLASVSLEGFDGDLAMWAAKRPVKWVGHDGEKTVTAFYSLGPTPTDRPTGPQTIAAAYVPTKEPDSFRGFGINKVWNDGWIYGVMLDEPLIASFPAERWIVRVTVNAFGANATPGSVSLDFSDPSTIRVPLSNPFDVEIQGFWIEVAAY